MALEVPIMELTRKRHGFTVDDYYRMAELGILPPGLRVELLDGDVVEMSAIGCPHAVSVCRLIDVFSALRGSAALRPQVPIHLGEKNEPEPDFVLARGESNDYAGAHPVPEDVWLLVEVSDSSLPFDRKEKGDIYARHGIREYWIVNLVEDVVEVHRAPSGDEPGTGKWGESFTVGRGGQIVPLAFPDFPVAADAILPPPSPAH